MQNVVGIREEDVHLDNYWISEKNNQVGEVLLAEMGSEAQITDSGKVRRAACQVCAPSELVIH